MFIRLTEIVHLHVGGQTIRTTQDHPFFVCNRGWVPLVEINASEYILTESGDWKCVDEVYFTGEIETVYNLRIADWHRYFVGDNWGWAAWAHNACFEVGYYNALPASSDYPRHHVPQQAIGAAYWSDYDPQNAPAIVLPAWMHYQVVHMTVAEFEEVHRGDIDFHIAWHLEQLRQMNVPKRARDELKSLIELYF